MKANLKTNYFFLLFLAMLNLCPLFAVKDLSSDLDQDNEAHVQALASLIFHLIELQELTDDTIQFCENEVINLWEKAASSCALTTPDEELNMIMRAESEYWHAVQLKALGQPVDAEDSLARCCEQLTLLWEKALDREDTARDVTTEKILRSKKRAIDPNVEDNPHISADAKKKMHPYLLPLSHPARPILDSLCKAKRITTDRKTFAHAGFETIAKRPRSYIRVASHPHLRHFLVKVYLDTVLRKKQKKESWEWLVLRCRGADQVHSVIKKKKIKHFIVAKKWIYCFPAEPSPPRDDLHTRHLALLVVTDMNLVSKEQNLNAWKHEITHEHLDELYHIISRAKGSSYRPDNITYTQKRKFAFIDTEYPGKGPDFKSIRHYLNDEMREYWDRVVKNGGS